jgi:signal transduction histidine kinase/CheY-like chemotaxis protein
MSEAPDTIDLLIRLASPEDRAEVARQTARRLGADDLVLLVHDPEVGALLPAAGLPQTLNGGPAWRSFLARCDRPGRYTGEVDLPSGTRRSTLAVVCDGVAAVLVGGSQIETEVKVLERLLPLLAATLVAEQRGVTAHAEAAAARDEVQRAHALASALERARAEGSRLNIELREEHRRKDHFLAMLAHELRNPLAPLVSSIELLRRGVLEPMARAQQIEVMARQVGLLSRLVEDLLDVSRVSRGRIELRRERLLVREVVAEAVEGSRPLIEARHHRLDVDLPDESLTIEADRVRLTQVFSNLLHNAAKYTDPGGRLSISVERQGEEVAVSFGDDGVGIAPELLPRIFDLFAQAPVSLDRAQGGLGIGLTLVRALVELHAGSVAADSAGRGRGSTFTVRLPLAEPAAAAAPDSAAPDLSRATDGTAPEVLRVLVVDDNEDAADSVRELLTVLLGHHAEVAYGGAVALQIAPDLDPDLLLLDLGLPEMDGYELARRLRRMVRPSARFVALTGYGSEDDRRRTREAGFDEHLVKPLMLEDLKAAVRRAAASRERAGEAPAARNG